MAKKRKRLDPLARARQAMADVLARAIESKDDDRIIAASKHVLQVFDKPAADDESPRSQGDPNLPENLPRDVEALTEEQFEELKVILDSDEAFWRRVNGMPPKP